MERIAHYTDLDIIDSYATHFGLDPDVVYNTSAFDTVVAFAIKWKDQSEFHKRFDNYRKLMNI